MYDFYIKVLDDQHKELLFLLVVFFLSLTFSLLVCSVQHRWERVVSKSAERTRALDHGYKEAREFHDAWYVPSLLGLNWNLDLILIKTAYRYFVIVNISQQNIFQVIKPFLEN